MRVHSLGALSVAAGLLLVTGLAAQQPGRPGKSPGFALFAAYGAIIDVNRVDCTAYATSELCGEPPFYDGIGGGFWPRGSANHHIFSSGPAVAGVVGPDGGPWAGDTTGAFFFDPKGTTQHGLGATSVYSSLDSADLANWPAAGLIFGPPYRPEAGGRKAIAEQDLWWASSEMNPGLLAGRPHPLGVVVTGRALEFNSPGGNEDIVYFVFTWYNATSLDPADYAGVPAGLGSFLLDQARQFHALNDQKFGIVLPSGGYTIEQFHPGLFSDPDVGDAGQNFASVNLPFRMAFAWDGHFGVYQGFSYPPELNSSPFALGAGIPGAMLLREPTGSDSIVSFSTTTNGGVFTDPQTTTELYRRFAGVRPLGNPDPCTFPTGSGICFIRESGPFDIRYHLSTGPFTLAPGQSVTTAWAYVFAAPVATGAMAACPGCSIDPGSPTIIAGLADPAIVAGGVNPIDSIAGFTGASDLNGDGRLELEEFTAVPRSLLAKAQIAQAVFENGFLTPSAPEPPEFFLIPGNRQVTVVWRPSTTEQTGDPYAALAAQPQVIRNGAPVPNVLYDPNFRQFDVEGYRIYRGRTDVPSVMEQMAQFDYSGTFISDYTGQVNPNQLCAPELGITAQCPVAFDPAQPGVARNAHVDIPLVGPIVQIRLGYRVALPNGTVYAIKADTVGSAQVCDLCDTGVPFVWVDSTVRNAFRYYYAVTAFDVNSVQSGPVSQESARVLKSVVPATLATNYALSGVSSTVRLEGRGRVLDTSLAVPTLDPGTGRFSGPFPPADGWAASLQEVVPALLPGPGEVRFRLDSIALGSPYENIPHTYWWTASSGSTVVRVGVPILQPQEIGIRSETEAVNAVPVDPSLAARYGGGPGYATMASVSQTLSGPDYMGLYQRGCINSRQGFGFSLECVYNGSRWFDGPSPQKNETRVHPNGGNIALLTGSPTTDYNNAGELTGVVTIHNTQAYQSVIGSEYRPVEGVKAGAHRAADFNVYWGSGGTVDSVVDVTHNVPVPFSPTMAGSWGILNASAAQPTAGSYDGRAELTATDMGCVPPLREYTTAISCGAGGPTYQLSRTAVPGPVVFFSPSLAVAQTAPAAANAGIVFYLAGDFFTMELQGGQVPPAGTVWSLRQYVGAIEGGNGAAGSYGPYQFSIPEGVLPLTAVGAEVVIAWDVTNRVLAPTDADLSRVHTVPDPYYFDNALEADPDHQVIQFVNLPQDAVIRIYSSSGVLVALLEHHSAQFGGTEEWNVRNRTGRRVASGVYFYHIEAGNSRRVGRFTVVNPQPGF